MKFARVLASAAFVLIAIGCSSERFTTENGVSSAQAAPPKDATQQVARLQQAEPEKSADPAPPKVGGFIGARIRATVNGKPILDDEVMESCYGQLKMIEMQLPEGAREEKQKEVFERELDKLVDREVILDDAEGKLKSRPQMLAKLKEIADKDYDKTLKSMRERSGAKSDEEFKAVMAAQRITMAGLKRQVERQFMCNEYMRSRIFPLIDMIGHEQILQYYNEHPGEFQVEDRVKWFDIFIDANSSKFPDRLAAKKFADDLVTRAKAGEDFAKLSIQYDMGDSGSYRKGEGCGQRHGEIKPTEVESVLFNMKEKEIGPVVELPNGFHVFKLELREYAGRQPFDEKTQVEVKKKLQNLIAEREYKRIVADLKERATITKFLDD